MIKYYYTFIVDFVTIATILGTGILGKSRIFYVLFNLSSRGGRRRLIVLLHLVAPCNRGRLQPLMSVFLWTWNHGPGLDLWWTVSMIPGPPQGGWSKRSMSIWLERSMIPCPKKYTHCEIGLFHFLFAFVCEVPKNPNLARMHLAVKL